MNTKWTKEQDVVGKKFHHLTILKQTRNLSRMMAECLCDCGKITQTRLSRVVSGFTKACRSCSAKTRKERFHLPSGESAFRRVLRNYRQSAQKRGLVFLLSQEQTKKLFLGTCFYCGKPPSKVFQLPRLFGKFTYNGIDRVNNDMGYQEYNCVSCCEACNFLKKDRPLPDFLKLIRQIEQNTRSIKI